MMIFKKIFDKLSGKIVISKEGHEGSKEEFIELGPDSIKKKSAKINVKYFVLTDFADIKPVIDSLREGYTICFIKIKPLKDKDLNALKRAVSKVKRTCEAIDGEVVGIDEDWVLAAPNFVTVLKGESAADAGISEVSNDEE